MTACDISVIVATHNRADCLEAALDSIAHSVLPGLTWELVVVDDGSDDGTPGILARLAQTWPERLAVYRLSPNAGLSAARNEGIRRARGRVLVFTDDDCRVPANWLATLTGPLSDASIGMTGGPDVTPEDQPFLARCIGFLLTSFVGTGGLRGTTRLRVGRYYPRGCNMAMRRDAIERVGGFDESLRMGEEIDMAYRMESAGYRLVFVPGATLLHRRRDRLRAHLRRVFNIGATRIALARRHPGISQRGHALPAVALVAATLLLAGSPFAPFAGRALGAALLLYAILLASAGAQAAWTLRRAAAAFAVPPLLALHHGVHALGFLWAGARVLAGRTPGRRAPERADAK